MSITVVSYMHGDLSYFELSKKINGHYCERHGYKYIPMTERPRLDTHVHWGKSAGLVKYLPPFGEYYLYIDADAIFYSQELRIEDELIPLLDKRDIVMACDKKGEEASAPFIKFPNTGVILMRSSWLVKTFLEEWNASQDLLKNEKRNRLVDQKGLWKYVLPKYEKHIRIVQNYYMMNGVHGHYIRHFLAMKDDDRKVKMEKIAERIFGTKSPDTPVEKISNISVGSLHPYAAPKDTL
jgi:hypothetical protein